MDTALHPFNNRDSVIICFYTTLLMLQLMKKNIYIYTSYATLSSGIPLEDPTRHLYFLVHTRAFRRVSIPRKYMWRVGYSTVIPRESVA